MQRRHRDSSNSGVRQGGGSLESDIAGLIGMEGSQSLPNSGIPEPSVPGMRTWRIWCPGWRPRVMG